MFFDLAAPIRDATNTFVNWLVVDYGAGFEQVSNALVSVLVAIEAVLRDAPPWAILAGTFALAFGATRRPFRALALTALLYTIGCLGLWDQAMQTLALLMVAMAIIVAAGIPLGMAVARGRRLRAVLLPLLDVMQTIPIFVYLLPAAMLFGLGKVPAIMATVIYALPPLVRLTDLGIREVPGEVTEASLSLGATSRRTLMSIQLPLALPSVLQGVNQSVMLALSMVVIASMIGARGLGETVLTGLQRNDSGQSLVGGLAIVALAVLIDRISQGFGLRLQAHRGGRA
jgi:glycine betaine/proline transport system permease protein